MSECGKMVILCKGLSKESDVEDRYVKTLESAGYSCKYLRTLRFEFINLSELRTCLSMADKYSGLILTSSRTVEAIALATKEDTSILQYWENLPAYCVGHATESLAQNQLNLHHCIGSDSGNSEQLAEKIVLNIGKNLKPLLYPCSEIARDTIACILNNKSVLVQKIVAYRTLESESLEQDLLEICKTLPGIFVFFSPSIVRYITAQLKKNSYSLEDIKAVAIGPTTKDALIKCGYNVYATSDKPEATALTCAITEAESKKIK